MSAVAVRSPRQVFCPTERLHRDMGVALDACVGCFRHAGTTIDVGVDPKWTRTDFHADREWWIEWSKFYYGLDLAAAFAETADSRFLRTWERLVASWIRQVPAGFGPTDAIGRRLQNWIYAWNAFERAAHFTGLSDGIADLIVGGIAEQAAYLQAHLTPERNHRTLELYGLLIVGLAFPDLEGEGNRVAFAWQTLQENLLEDFRPDGVHREHSTHYHMVALRSFLGALENARRFGLSIPDVVEQRVTRAVEFAAWCQRPDGSIPTLSDSDSADYREELRLAADLLCDDEFRYVASNGAAGVPPQTRRASFEESGYHVQRSAWNDLSVGSATHRHLVFDCGPLGDGGHGHYDLLSVDVWAGQPLVIDPGRYTYFEGTPNWRHWFKGTRAHNTVCVDGLDQVQYRAGKPRGGLAAARPIACTFTSSLDVLAGEARSPEYDALHRRYVLFVASQYWIVIDRLEAPSPHDYELRWHLPPHSWCDHAAGAATPRVDLQRTFAHGAKVVGPSGTLLIDGVSRVEIEAGWASRLYGVKHEAPVVSARVEHRASALFVTALLPACLEWASKANLWVANDAQENIDIRVCSDRNHHRLEDRIAWSGSDVFTHTRTAA